jgi:predicted MFS family arabinose efflux permease
MTSRRAALWALSIIFAANFLNYIDRTLVSALERPLSQALDLKKAQFGLLWTLFTIGYMLCAVPIGLLADRYSRTRLFALCIFIWSLATVGSGLAERKEVLYVARVFIGVGEAGCLIIGPSLLSDFFAAKFRGRALSVFYLGLPLGGTAAFIMAGLLLNHVGWRELFYVAGIPGFVVAALIALLPDPPRGATEAAHNGVSTGDLRHYLQLLQTPTLLLIILAQAFAAFTIIPLIHFGVEFFVGTRGMGKTEARVSLGLMALVAGALGNTLSGVVGDHFAKRWSGAYAWLAGIGFLVGWPCLLVGFSAESRWLFLPALTLGCFFYFLCMPAVNTQIANVVSPRQRASAWALAVFILHLLGDTLAPWLFGKVEDQGLEREHVFLCFSLALPLAGVCCLIGGFTARKDVERLAHPAEKEIEIEVDAHAAQAEIAD